MIFVVKIYYLLALRTLNLSIATCEVFYSLSAVRRAFSFKMCPSLRIYVARSWRNQALQKLQALPEMPDFRKSLWHMYLSLRPLAVKQSSKRWEVFWSTNVSVYKFLSFWSIYTYQSFRIENHIMNEHWIYTRRDSSTVVWNCCFLTHFRMYLNWCVIKLYYINN